MFYLRTFTVKDWNFLIISCNNCLSVHGCHHICQVSINKHKTKKNLFNIFFKISAFLKQSNQIFDVKNWQLPELYIINQFKIKMVSMPYRHQNFSSLNSVLSTQILKGYVHKFEVNIQNWGLVLTTEKLMTAGLFLPL